MVAEEDVEGQEAGDSAGQERETGRAAQGQQVRLNVEDVSPEYANFCTLTVRQNEVIMSFGKAFAPSEELDVDNQIVMSMDNIQNLYTTLGQLLEQQDRLPE